MEDGKRAASGMPSFVSSPVAQNMYANLSVVYCYCYVCFMVKIRPFLARLDSSSVLFQHDFYARVSLLSAPVLLEAEAVEFAAIVFLSQIASARHVLVLQTEKVEVANIDGLRLGYIFY